MKRTISAVLGAGCVMLVACSVPAETKGAKADANAAAPDMIEPGLYRVTTSVLALGMDGAPAIDDLSQPPPQEYCLLEARSRRFDEIRTGEAGVSCTQNANNVSSGGRIEASATCTNLEGFADERRTTGSYTSNRYEYEWSATSTAPDGRRMVARTRIVGERVGDCTTDSFGPSPASR